jgi:hypothetical protein
MENSTQEIENTDNWSQMKNIYKNIYIRMRIRTKSEEEEDVELELIYI